MINFLFIFSFLFFIIVYYWFIRQSFIEEIENNSNLKKALFLTYETMSEKQKQKKNDIKKTHRDREQKKSIYIIIDI